MQQGESHPGANFDDDFFVVNEAQKLPRPEIMMLMVTLGALQDDVENRLDLEQFNSEFQAELRRRKRQVQWCQMRLGVMKIEAKLGVTPEVKADRRRSFYEHFFFICQNDFLKDDFTRLCKLAEARAQDESPLDPT